MEKQEILLESGTNEMELLTFLVGGQSFGINVAKVKSIEQYDASGVSSLPRTPPALFGMILYRDTTVPLIDLATVLGIDVDAGLEKQIVIVTEFNNFISGFKVDSVERIHRLSWNDFVPINRVISNSSTSIIGTVHIGDLEVLVIDVETIVAGILPDMAFEKVEDNYRETSGREKRKNVSILFAEDSGVIRNKVMGILQETGYAAIRAFNNGRDAYEFLEKQAAVGPGEGNGQGQMPDIIISDIEMPLMDGLTLCRKVKEHSRLEHIPVIMFSSLINQQMIAKCDSVGASGYITKPQMNRLVGLIDKFCLPADN